MGAVLKRWNGSAWEVKPLKYWNGSAWVTKPLKYWNGSAWVGGAVIYADDFNRANGTLETTPVASGGWSWTHDGLIASACSVSSNQLRCGTGISAGSAYKTPNLGTADHYVQFKTTSVSLSTGAFCCCRLADNSNFVGIRAGNGGSNGQIEVFRRITGSLGSLYVSAASAFVVGDVLRLECSGTNFTVKKNGVVITGPTAIGGPSLTSTGTGVVARSVTGNFADDFEAGTL